MPPQGPDVSGLLGSLDGGVELALKLVDPPLARSVLLDGRTGLELEEEVGVLILSGFQPVLGVGELVLELLFSTSKG